MNKEIQQTEQSVDRKTRTHYIVATVISLPLIVFIFLQLLRFNVDFFRQSESIIAPVILLGTSYIIGIALISIIIIYSIKIISPSHSKSWIHIRTFFWAYALISYAILYILIVIDMLKAVPVITSDVGMAIQTAPSQIEIIIQIISKFIKVLFL